MSDKMDTLSNILAILVVVLSVLVFFYARLEGNTLKLVEKQRALIVAYEAEAKYLAGQAARRDTVRVVVRDTVVVQTPPVVRVQKVVVRDTVIWERPATEYIALKARIQQLEDHITQLKAIPDASCGTSESAPPEPVRWDRHVGGI